MNILDIQLLGPLRILINGQPLQFRGSNQPRNHDHIAEAILVVCLAYSRRPVGVQTLYTLLWGKAPSGNRYPELTRALWAFKSGLEYGGSSEDFAKHCLEYRPSEGRMVFNVACAHSYDVQEFEAIVGDATPKTPLTVLEQARDLYHGPFLEAFPVTHFDTGFERWVEGRRAELAGAYHKLLHLLSLQYLARGDWPTAITSLTPLLPAGGREKGRRRPRPADEQEDSAKRDRAAQDYEVVCGLLMTCYALTQRLDLAQQTYTHYRQTMRKAPYSRHPAPALAKLNALMQSQSLSTLRTERLIAEALHQISHKEMVPRLQDALESIYGVLLPPSASLRSPSVQAVLDRAEEEARRQGASLVGTPHLVLALCDAADDAIPPPLTRLPVCLNTIAEAIRYILGEAPAGSQPRIGAWLFHGRVLQVASALAIRMQAEALDVPHLWLALLQEKHSLLSQVLARHGIDHDEVRKALEEELVPEL